MYRKLLLLELKSFFRNPSFGANLAFKILTFFGLFYMAAILVGLPFALFYFSKEELNADPLQIFCKFFIYYWAFDLIVRYFVQQMPTQNIKPFLTIGITKKKLVNYTMLKILTNFFNWGNLLFLIPFAGLLLFDGGYSSISVLLFTLSIFFVFYGNNFLNILLNGKDWVVFVVFGAMTILAALDYYHVLSLSALSAKVFYLFYTMPNLIVVPLLITCVLGYLAYRQIYDNFYLDKGLELKKAVGKTENIEFLNRYGVLGTFINNDIRLLRRSKAAKSAVIAGVAFLFYGLLVFNRAYQNDFMQLFCGIFATGGFMMMFGQRVPAWDSSYYPLMMTQNVPYKEYLRAKWSLVILAILVSMILCTGYLFVSLDFYLTVVAAGLYNLGVNSYITLLAGAFNKKPIDLNSSSKSFSGGGNNFNMKIMLLLIPQLVVPVVVFGTSKYFFGIYGAVLSLAILGIVGFLLRDKIFDKIVRIYRTQKYSTIEAFKKTA